MAGGVGSALAAIGVAAPQDDEQWGANVCLNCTWQQGLLGSWGPVATGFREPANFGDLVFTRSGPVAGVQSLQPLLAGRGKMTAAVYGDGEAVSSLKIWPVGEEQPLVDVEGSASEAGGLEFALPEVAAGDAPVQYRGELRVSYAGAPLLICPFQMSATSRLQLAVRAYVQDRKLEVEVAAGPGLPRPEEHSCVVSVAPRGGQAAKSVEVPQLSPTGPTIVTFEGDDLPAKDVTVTAAVLDQAGKIVYQASRESTGLGEAEPRDLSNIDSFKSPALVWGLETSQIVEPHRKCNRSKQQTD